MKMSLKWIHEFVDIQEFFSEPEKLGEILTQAGLEVEEIVNRVKDYNQVVIGIVLEKEVHPNADKLSLCRVSVGPNEIHQIICGAQNHKKGDRVVVALPGAVLPGNFAIQKAKIRSIESHGMLCSEKELALAKESEGILILPTEAPIGESFAKYYGLDDVIFDLKVTPNRADGLSHLGLAREISCLLGRALKQPSTKLKLSAGKTSDKIKVSLKEPKSCLRYSGRYIKNIKVQESPLWLKKRLESLGMNSINNVVDVTNYVLMEMGQPLHAFDADLISGHSLKIENVKKDEKFITLDGSELHFSGSELGICDQERTLVLAGVIGGKNSGVSVDTKNIFLECAYFSPEVIRKTSRYFGIETDSSYRFSRGVDPNLIPHVLDRATELVLAVGEGEALSEIIDLYPEPVVKKTIFISLNTISDRLGYPVEKSSFESFMKGLGCEVTEVTEDKVASRSEYQIIPPSFRVDLEVEMDLVEEYARLKGYEHIPETLPSMKEAPKFQDKNFQLIQSFSENWVQWGYQEAINFVFLSEKKENEILGDRKNLSSFGLDMPGEKVFLKNPLNESMNVMRSSLIPGLLENAISNFRYGNEWGRLFEVGSVFGKSIELDPVGFHEPQRLALMAWGRPFGFWEGKENYPLIYQVKSQVEGFFQKIGMSSLTWSQKKEGPWAPLMHQGQTASLIVEGKTLGYISSLHPQWIEKEKLKGEFVFCEIQLDLILNQLPRPYKAKTPNKLPILYRDLALVMKNSIAAGEVMKEIKKQAGSVLQDLRIFDVYQGEKIEAGKKSLAIRIFLQDPKETLQDAKADEITGKILESLSKKFEIELRK